MGSRDGPPAAHSPIKAAFPADQPPVVPCTRPQKPAAEPLRMMVLGAGAFLAPQRAWLQQHKRAQGQAALGLGFKPRPALQHRLLPLAAYKANPKYNKYRSRQTVEKEYYREWERTAALNESYAGRKRTPLSTIVALPPLVKFYIIPGPLRYLWSFVWQAVLAVAQRVQRLLILQGCKLESALLRRAGQPGGVQQRLALLRWHGRIPLAEEFKYWAALLQGKPYSPELSAPEEGDYGPNYMPRGYTEAVPA